VEKNGGSGEEKGEASIKKGGLHNSLQFDRLRTGPPFSNFFVFFFFFNFFWVL
jgi:hypothetical protein